MSESSQDWVEKAREIEARLFADLRTDGKRQADIVRRTGLDKSKVERIINGFASDLCKILACQGYDFAAPNTVQVPVEDFDAVSRFAARYLMEAASKDKGR
jgi:hypothetical protein